MAAKKATCKLQVNPGRAQLAAETKGARSRAPFTFTSALAGAEG